VPQLHRGNSVRIELKVSTGDQKLNINLLLGENMKKQYLLLALILLFLSIGAFRPFGCKKTISGKITDINTAPIEGAIVTLEGYETVKTNHEGIYTISDVPYGTYTMSVSSSGYITKPSETISTNYFENGVTCKDISGVNIILTKETSHTYWQEIGTGSASGGGISNALENTFSPSLSINGSGNPVVAWGDGIRESGDAKVYLKQWNGSSWEELGGSASGGGISSNGYSDRVLLAINNSGNPVVMWDDLDNDEPPHFQIFLKQWNGSSWEELGGSATGWGVSNSTGNSRRPSLAINDSGNIVVTWIEFIRSDVYVKQWNGSAWEELGGSATGGGISNTGEAAIPSVAINDSGKPVVAWYDDSSGDYEIYLKQWNGSSWEEIGSGSASGGGISNNTGASVEPSLAINDSGNPIVAWHDGVFPDYDIYLKQWNGSSWEELGGSASGGGISDNTGGSYRPSLAINGLGNPVVAWYDNTSGDTEIYIKQWNGSSWEEIGTNSATGGGISDNNGDSVWHSLAIDGSGNPVVAWSDDSSGNFEIYLKQYAPDN